MPRQSHATSPPFALGRDFLATVAEAPGVYLMRDAGGTVLYVGKAVNLRKRLASYARHSGGDLSKTAMLLSRIRTIETILTRTEKEALILEAALIKQHRPKYNVILRDDKNYPLIKVTVQEEWPRVVMTRRRVPDGARYFGPFASPGAMWETLRLLNELFPLRRCKGGSFSRQTRACLNFQLGRCLAPCVGRISHADYLAMVEGVLLVLEGRTGQLLTALTSRMEQAARELRFEEAARCRDRLRSVRQTLEKQVVLAAHRRDQDVFGLVRQGSGVAVMVLFIRQGVLSGRQSYFLTDPVGDDASLLAELLPRFYEPGRLVPREILIPFAVEEMATIAEWLGEREGKRVTIAAPQRGDKARLIEMANANAEQLFAEQRQRAHSWERLAGELQKALHLAQPPHAIECLDISNLGGRQAVGSLVRFEAGEEKKSGYRHYRIRAMKTPDDYAMMAEVLARRLSRGQDEGGLPDLLLLDGGKGQLNIAVRAMAEAGLAGTPELAAIAKEREAEGEKLFRPGRRNPILLPRHSPALLYLMRIRDEAHRYGITFHKRLRSKATLTSALDAVPGIGPAKKKALLSHFGSLRALAAADPAEIAAVPGIGPALARVIHQGVQPAASSGPSP
ncbi:MAG: excinuclease ABC subunit UvrC [Thermodesulfobacteriota bacterium]